MSLSFTIKFFILIILIFSNTSTYAVEINKSPDQLENKINNLNQVIDLQIKKIVQAIESGQESSELKFEIETLSALIDTNMIRLDIQVEIQREIDTLSSKLNNTLHELKIQKEIDILSSQVSDELNQLIINKNIETCKRYSFVEGTELYMKCLLNLILAESSSKFNR